MELLAEVPNCFRNMLQKASLDSLDYSDYSDLEEKLGRGVVVLRPLV